MLTLLVQAIIQADTRANTRRTIISSKQSLVVTYITLLLMTYYSCTEKHKW